MRDPCVYDLFSLHHMINGEKSSGKAGMIRYDAHSAPDRKVPKEYLVWAGDEAEFLGNGLESEAWIPNHGTKVDLRIYMDCAQILRKSKCTTIHQYLVPFRVMANDRNENCGGAIVKRAGPDIGHEFVEKDVIPGSNF